MSALHNLKLDVREFLDDLAHEYHQQVGSYRNSVCTGPKVDGYATPANIPEQGLVTQFERYLFKDLTKQVVAKGLRQGDFRIALVNYKHSPPPFAM